AVPDGVVTSNRIPLPVFGLGLLEAVPEATVLAVADPDDLDGDGVSGRPNWVWDMEQQADALGRFGWKANMPNLQQQSAAAYANDMGVSNPMFPAADGSQDIDLAILDSATAYVQTLAVPSNAAAIFPVLVDAKERAKLGLELDVLLPELRRRMAAIPEAQIFVIPPPPVRGIGTGGGFKMQIQDRSGAGLKVLEEVTNQIVAKANEEPGLVQVFSTFRTATPQIYADVDRTRVRMLDVPISNVFEALQIYLGSSYVNDFNYLGRTYRVTVQADSKFRDEEADIARLRTRSNSGAIVPLGSLITMRKTTAPARVVRYNLYPAADINGATLPGFSSGQAIKAMERIAEETLPPGFGYEWTDLSYQQKTAGNTSVYIFPLCVLFVFLALSAQYESWLLPLAVILIVPLCLLFAIFGVWFRGMDNNILTQIGFVVLVGLACKNAILIVEFAKAEEDNGRTRFEAAVEACRLRLRPILMTALSFVLGVIPLLIATGAGSEMRQALGTAVFSGMLGVTVFGLFLTPVFYVVLRKFGSEPSKMASRSGPPIAPGDATTHDTAAVASSKSEVVADERAAGTAEADAVADQEDDAPASE
ncbi:MAG: efflux RND transporter permease subunit, partial [Planctomycetota bacterium]